MGEHEVLWGILGLAVFIMGYGIGHTNGKEEGGKKGRSVGFSMGWESGYKTGQEDKENGINRFARSSTVNAFSDPLLEDLPSADDYKKWS